MRGLRKYNAGPKDKECQTETSDVCPDRGVVRQRSAGGWCLGATATRFRLSLGASLTEPEVIREMVVVPGD
ncbi:hypothetical protein NDU88_004529 [Pleurodeles waltl]|uniref:Uncharacterized protein n=1 Tax=Pleurodeles waltl TaxID=8319 RepID=A0AAV7UFM1_PLEWA|nr:hypothetical protein NDU88_004529 [Pleurodeles waltl]